MAQLASYFWQPQRLQISKKNSPSWVARRDLTPLQKASQKMTQKRQGQKTKNLKTSIKVLNKQEAT